MASHTWTDRAGTVMSSLCAVHCAAVAMIPALFSALGLGFLLGQTTEWIFALGAIGFALAALVLGWRKHRSAAVGALLVLGIVGVLGSRALEVGVAHDHDDHHAAAHDHDHEHGHAAAHDEAEHAHEVSSELTHLLGAAIGTFAGGLLVAGHFLNLRASRRRRDACCDDAVADFPSAEATRHHARGR